jgi:hypothetical protein
MMPYTLLHKKQMVLCVMLCLFFDRVVSYCGANLTRRTVTENLNVFRLRDLYHGYRFNSRE